MVGFSEYSLNHTRAGTLPVPVAESLVSVLRNENPMRTLKDRVSDTGSVLRWLQTAKQSFGTDPQGEAY